MATLTYHAIGGGLISSSDFFIVPSCGVVVLINSNQSMLVPWHAVISIVAPGSYFESFPSEVVNG